jgi:hypothetical protein
MTQLRPDIVLIKYSDPGAEAAVYISTKRHALIRLYWSIEYFQSMKPFHVLIFLVSTSLSGNKLVRASSLTTPFSLIQLLSHAAGKFHPINGIRSFYRIQITTE